MNYAYICLCIYTVQYRSKVSWHSVASLDSPCESRFTPLRVSSLDSRFLRESRIENKLSRIESRIESRRTEKKDSPMTDFSIILQRHTAVTQCKNQTLSRACYFIEYKDFSDVREVRRLLKTWSKVVTFRFSSSQISRVESELLETKQRPFRLMSLARIENQVSRIEPQFSTRFSMLDSREDRESSVNLLLNGTVHG